MNTAGLISFWDFQEVPGHGFCAKGQHSYRLEERDGFPERVADGVFGPQSLRFGAGPWLSAPRVTCPGLDRSGPDARVTLMAWIKREPAPTDLTASCQAVAGMWNEHGRRQYCLFLNLGIWDSAEQVGAHVSRVGGPTPGYKYCMDAAIGATPVPFDRWSCVAMTYDGTHAKAYLDGRLDHRGLRNPFACPGGFYDAGPDGADFTVGAVDRPATVTDDFREVGHVVANCFHGLLGGLAVFDRALDDQEIATLASA